MIQNYALESRGTQKSANPKHTKNINQREKQNEAHSVKLAMS